jgi:hypothetical protein
MIEILQIFWQLEIGLQVIILGVPICFLILHKEI